jgi:DNA-binding CsgD family transcriptional regulator
MRTYRGVQDHLHAIDELARWSNDQERKEIVRELLGLAAGVLSYTTPVMQPVPVEASTPDYASLLPDKAASLKRKAAMLRLCLQREPMKAIAEAHGITRVAVRSHLTELMRILRKRTRTVSRFKGGGDPLAGVHRNPLELTHEEQAVYLCALDQFDRELVRREAGQEWGDIWQVSKCG